MIKKYLILLIGLCFLAAPAWAINPQILQLAGEGSCFSIVGECEEEQEENIQYAAADAWAISPAIFGNMGQGAAGGGGGGIPTATAHYLLNNDVTDETGDHNATAQGAFAYDDTNKVEGSHAGLFNDGNYFSVADHADFEPGAGDWSFSTWFRSTWLGTENVIMSKTVWTSRREGYDIRIEDADADNLHLIISDDTADTNVDTNWALVVDTWYHLVVAYDASNANEFQVWVSAHGGAFGDQINGTQYDCDRTPDDEASSWKVGQEGIDNSDFRGQQDDVRWWKGTAINATQAEALYDLY